MAIEDIPPRRSGLGKSFGEILANAPAVGPRTESVIFGGEVTATPEEVKESLTYVTGPSLPPPSEVIIIDQAYGTRTPTRGKRAAGTFKRPDLDPSAYSQGSSKSTRVWGIQWIPTILLEPVGPAGEDSSARDYLSGYDFKEVNKTKIFYCLFCFKKMNKVIIFFIY